MEHPTRIGKYELVQFLGGGMSHVYRARDSVLGRTVALKILTDEGAKDEEAKARFLLEARMASNINHENIISVYDFGEEQGRPFIVMEFLQGESLRETMKGGREGDLSRKLNIALQIGRALEYIHSRKIIHRDIKPENVHVDLTGKVKLMDFGIAKSEGLQLTRAGFTLGTPYYMAPEQVLGQQLTPLADVYAFGVLLFELIARVKPITGESVERIFNQILSEPLNPDPLRTAGAPQAVVDLIMRCTAKQPAQRPQGFGVVCGEIQHIMDPSVPVPKPASTLPVPPIRLPSKPQAAPAKQKTPPRPQAITPAHRASAQGLPSFVLLLPPPLRTTTGLMVLAGGAALLAVLVLFMILRLTRVIN
jgi:serine/threonine-protein kinase